MTLGYYDIVAAFAHGTWKCYRGKSQLTVNEMSINPNSINVTLGNIALKPKRPWWRPVDLHDAKSVDWKKIEFEKIHVGFPFFPFYLMNVRERFDCSQPLLIDGKHRYFYPVIDGRSTPARASGLQVHSTAGFGDYGFCANFTLEVSTVLPVVLRAGDELSQVSFREVSNPKEYNSVYSDQFNEPRAPVLGEDRMQPSFRFPRSHSTNLMFEIFERARARGERKQTNEELTEIER